MADTFSLPDFDKAWNYADPAATEAAFRELLPAAEESGNTDYRAQLLSQLARAQGLQGLFVEADETLEQAEFICNDNDRVALARILLERGRVRNSSGSPRDAIPYFERAYDVARGAGAWRYAIDSLHMLGIAAATPEEQVEWGLKGITAVQEHPDQRGWLWALYNNIGESYLKLGDYSAAHLYFTKLAEYQQERTGAVDVYTEKDIAKIERLMGKPEAALPVMQKLLQEAIASGDDNGYFRLELGEDLAALGRDDEAQPHFLKAYELLSSDNWFKENEPAAFERLRALAGH